MRMRVVLGVCGERSVAACGRCDRRAYVDGSIFPPPGARPTGILRRSAHLEVRCISDSEGSVGVVSI